MHGNRLAALATAVAIALAAVAPSAIGQEVESPQADRAQRASAQRQPAGQAQPLPVRLPADQVTQHTLELPGRTLQFSATVGSIPLRGDDGRLLAEFSYIAYTVPGMAPAKRPVTFAFNGGPGSSSVWLHLGALGPWRLPIDAPQPSASSPPIVTANAETFLDFTDLVFIDPIGTGYSRIAGRRQQQQPGGQTPPAAQQGGGREAGSRDSGGTRYFWSVNGDVESVAEFIQLWLKKTSRHVSPKIIIGESYGGIRGPKVVSTLQKRHGVGIHALVLVSPMIEYGIRGSWRGSSPVGLVSLLPSLAASAIERKDNGAVVSRAMLAAAESYARTGYLADLLQGPNDTAAVDRMTRRVAELVDLPEPVVRQYGGRLDSFIYRREANRATGRMASLYDSSVTSFDPEPTSYLPASQEDPFISGYTAPLTSAIIDLYTGRLGYRVDATYQMTNRSALREWVYPNSPYAVNSVGDLRAILALDPELKVLVAHGFTDTITPYFASDMVLTQIPAYGGDATRLRLVVYPGGHMFYSRERSRKAFRDEVSKLLE